MSAFRLTVEDPHGAIPAALLAELTAELLARYPELPALIGFDGSGEFSPDDVSVPRPTFVVLWDCDEALGCGALRPLSDPELAELKRMYVRPAARGRGASRLLLAQLEAMAREFGYRALRLETGDRQLEALGLYESAGFRRIDCYDNYLNDPTSVCYEKVL